MSDYAKSLFFIYIASCVMYVFLALESKAGFHFNFHYSRQSLTDRYRYACSSQRKFGMGINKYRRLSKEFGQ